MRQVVVYKSLKTMENINHKAQKLVMVAYRRWSFTRIEPQGAFSEKSSRHIYFLEDNLLHAMSKL